MRLDDGWQTLLTCAAAPNIALYEKTVQPPGVIGGGANDTTTMHNEVWRTKSPKHLKELSDANMNCAYDPAVIDDIIAQVNVNQLWTVTYPDGSSETFWGWLDEFIPAEHKEGEQPTASVKIIPSNQDADLVETGPDFTAAP